MSIKLSRANSGSPLTVSDYNSDNLIIETAINDLQDATSTDGTVTNVSDIDTDVAELFTTSIANPTSTPAITYTRSTKAANLVYASPNGSSGKGSFRSLVSSDLPTVPFAKGGLGLTSITANKIPRVNNAGTAYALGEIKAGSNKLSVSLTDPDITLDVVSANIPIDDLNGSTPLSIAKGGTGAATAQNAINALSQVSSASSGQVLTKVGSNAYFAALPDIVTAKITNNNVTYAKIQQVGAAKILGNPTNAAANVQEISVGSGLIFDGITLKQRQGVYGSITANYSMTISDGAIYADATGGDIIVTLPTISTLVGGEIFTVKRTNSGIRTVTLRVQDLANDVIDGATEQVLNGQYHAYTFQYVGSVGGKNTFYIINLVP